MTLSLLSLQGRADLEVIHRTGEHANRAVVSTLLALGYIYESHDRLYLTFKGKRELRG